MISTRERGDLSVGFGQARKNWVGCRRFAIFEVVTALLALCGGAFAQEAKEPTRRSLSGRWPR